MGSCGGRLVRKSVLRSLRERRKIDIAAISQKSRDYFNINLDNGFRIFTENQIILIKLKAIISTCTANLIYSCML